MKNQLDNASLFQEWPAVIAALIEIVNCSSAPLRGIWGSVRRRSLLVNLGELL